MRILVVGADSRGSFEMRGRQLGHALGARITINPSSADWKWADAIVLVKRAVSIWGPQAMRTGVPLLWDVVDVWKQPDENQLPVLTLSDRVRATVRTLHITTVVGATGAMAEDIGGVSLPHHCRLDLAPVSPKREGTIVVAYEGQPKYLGPWRTELEYACADLGYAFVINPPDLRAVDVVVALRGGRWDGDVCRRWKSGVKYANALVAGKPVLSQPTAGFDDVGPTGLLIDQSIDLRSRLDTLASLSVRMEAYQRARCRASEFSLSTIARRYREIINHTVLRSAA